MSTRQLIYKPLQAARMANPVHVCSSGMSGIYDMRPVLYSVRTHGSCAQVLYSGHDFIILRYL